LDAHLRRVGTPLKFSSARSNYVLEIVRGIERLFAVFMQVRGALGHWRVVEA
jgi:hypothetical protein